jgi:hypothetical protein
MPAATTGRRAAAIATVAILAVLAFPAVGATPHPANPGVRSPSGGCTIDVPAGGDFQNALDTAVPGDTICLAAGATYRGSFTLRNKTGAGWIAIESKSLASLPPPGERVFPSHSALMARLLSSSSAPVIDAAPGAHHYRLSGLEIASDPAVGFHYGLIGLGDGGATDVNTLPHDIVVDRCYIHGDPSQEVKRGITLNSRSTEIRDSYIADIHLKAQDSQAIGGFNGPGPYVIENNYLEGAAENIMFGGADPAINGLVPSDIKVLRNHIAKPLAWKQSGNWSVKNLFELKNANRVLVEGNLMENNWVGADQHGSAIVLTVRNQDGNAPWSTVENVTIRNNVVRWSGEAISGHGRDSNPSQLSRNFRISNNLFDHMDHLVFDTKSRGRFLTFTEVVNMSVEHNTVFQTGEVFFGHSQPMPQFSFANNLMGRGNYGVTGDAVGEGTVALDKYAPAWTFAGNVVGDMPSGTVARYPSGNFYPPDLNDSKFVDRVGGNYRLDASSPYKGKATDGMDPGADFDTLGAATCGVVQGKPCGGGAGDIYVSPSGNDSHPGTITQPVLTPQRGVDLVAPGSTVFLRAGDYELSRPVQIYKSDVTIRAYQTEKARVWGVTNDEPSLPNIIVADRAERLKILDLEIEGGYYYGVKIDWGNDTVVKGNRIHGTGRDGIKTFNSDGLLIEGNEIYSTGVRDPSNAEGIDSIGSIRVTIRGNHVHDTATNGLYVKGGPRWAVIERNLVERPGHAGILVGQSTDLQYMRDGTKYEARDSVARNNIVVDAPGAGVGTYAGNNISLIGNTLVNVSKTMNGGLYIVTNERNVSAENVTMKDNVVIVGGTRPHIFTVEYWDAMDSDSNLFFRPGGGGYAFWRELNGSGDYWDSLAKWQAGTGADLRSKTGDPLLDTAALHRPLAGSPAVDGGEGLALLKDDYSGIARPQGNGTDIGAHEIKQGGGGTNRPPAVPTLSGPTNGTVNASLSFNVSAVDPDGDRVTFEVDWGDGANSSAGPVDSGASAASAHSWAFPGNYPVKSRARDTLAATSNWSGVHAVTITKTEPPPNGSDTNPPVIAHTPVLASYPETTIKIQAKVTDDRKLASVALYYREYGGSYQKAAMKGAADSFEAWIPAPVVVPAGVEYYIEALDAAGNIARHPKTAPGEPHRIAIVHGDPAPPDASPWPLLAISAVVAIAAVLTALLAAFLVRRRRRRARSPGQDWNAEQPFQ